MKIPATNLREPRGADETSSEPSGAAGADTAGAGCNDSNGSAANVVWWWEFDGHRLPYALGQPIRFRVTDVFFAKEEGTERKRVQSSGAALYLAVRTASRAFGVCVAAHRKQHLVENQETYTPPMVVVVRESAKQLRVFRGLSRCSPLRLSGVCGAAGTGDRRWSRNAGVVVVNTLLKFCELWNLLAFAV